MLQNLQNVARFQKFQLDNLVDFEKCCKTRIFLQKSVPIQPKTSDILPSLPAPPPRGGPRGLRRRARALGGRAGLSRPARKLAKLAEFQHSSSFSLSEIHVLIEFTF